MLDQRSVGWLAGGSALGFFVGILLGFLIWSGVAAPAEAPSPSPACRRAVQVAREQLRLETIGPELSDEYLELLRRATRAAAKLDTLALEDMLAELERLNDRLREALKRGPTGRFEILADRCLSE